MKHRSLIPVALVAILLILLSLSPAVAGGDVNFLLGQKILDEEDWGSADEQGEFGVLTSFGRDEWPVDIAIDLLTSYRWFDVTPDGFDVELFRTTVEFDVGVRKIWERGNARPFLGGGLAFVAADIEIESGGVAVGTSDNGPGLWIDGGVFWRLGPRFNIGFEGRITRAEVTILGQDVEAGGEHFGLLLGWGW